MTHHHNGMTGMQTANTVHNTADCGTETYHNWLDHT